VDQSGNSPAPQQIDYDNNENIQRTLINNIGVSDTNLNTSHTSISTPRSNAQRFFVNLQNDTRIYYVIYSELNPLEIVQLLNNLSHIPDYLLPHHYNL
jgi:hypothetical protein